MEASLSRGVMSFIVAGATLALPQMLGIVTQVTVSTSDVTTGGALGQMTSITDLMSAMGYIMGIMFSIKGTFELKNYFENGGGNYVDYKGVNSDISKESLLEVSVVKNESPKLSLVKEEKIIKINKETVEIKNSLFKFNLDFENDLLNNKLIEIEKTINSILSLPLFEQEIENKLLVSSTQEKYIQQIHKAYIAIPKELRDKKIKNSTARVLAMEQLILIHNGLLEIETEILKEQIKDLNIMERFLKEKFPEQKQYITLGRLNE